MWWKSDIVTALLRTNNMTVNDRIVIFWPNDSLSYELVILQVKFKTKNTRWRFCFQIFQVKWHHLTCYRSEFLSTQELFRWSVSCWYDWSFPAVLWTVSHNPPEEENFQLPHKGLLRETCCLKESLEDLRNKLKSSALFFWSDRFPSF